MSPTEISLVRTKALPTTAEAVGGFTRRLYFMDNLRVALTVLIVLQHSSFAYAAGSWWYFTDAQQEPLLSAFFVVNRSFRMSLFFLIAGYFMPFVFDRKGPEQYLKDRFRRLGIPLVFFLFFVFPPLMYAYYLNFRSYGYMDLIHYYWYIYWGFNYQHAPDWSGPNWPDRQLGHLWFIQMLLIYAIAYALWRWIRDRLPLPRLERPLPQPGLLVLLPVLILVATASFLVRLYDPIYQWHAYLRTFQLQPADFPRDLACFILGVLAYRNNWLLGLPKRTGYRWLAVGVGGALIFVVADLTGHSFFSMGGDSFNGVVYPIWETFTCFGLCLGLPTLFREYLDFQTPFLQKLSLASYGVYLFHLPMVVALQYALAAAPWPAAVKFAVVAAIAVPSAFLFTTALRRWRPVQRII